MEVGGWDFGGQKVHKFLLIFTNTVYAEISATANLKTSFWFVYKLLMCVSDFMLKADSFISDTGTPGSPTAIKA